MPACLSHLKELLFIIAESEDAKTPKEPAERSQKSRGIRKNKLKAKLIIRNLSFKVSNFNAFGVQVTNSVVGMVH